ncbi:hypothetical protein TIFTF001_003343 [Ficus carica]|uniref:Uncharacterized protein n=1 Tax=Ficus carica TaxID=3494 RepID=A0AA87Z8M1_FICCA|nr:hypothetical protein TIFTF001_003343 [Ficus carica]
MSSMQYCYKSAQKETCKEKCLESCYGHKPNNSGSYYAGQSTALYGQSTPYACTDHNMTKPVMNHSSYDQTLFGQPTMTPNPNMSHNSYRKQTYGHHMTAAKPVGMGQNHCVDKVHGHGHGHEGRQHYANSHGMGSSCYGNKSNEKKMKEKKGDYCKKKKDKSLCKNKYRDGNRSCSDSSGPDSD